MPKYRSNSWRAFRPESAGLSVKAQSPRRGLASGAVRILGLDPGSQRTGYGIVECRADGIVHVAHGCIDAGREHFLERLRRIHGEVTALMAHYAPHEVSIERVFVKRNIDSALKLGQARGAALAAVPRAVPVFEYAPRAVKLATVGSGAAEKAQVAHMICSLLELRDSPRADASDALAIAFCHAQSRALRELMLRDAEGGA
jgi:crossover junction endodeoxyribonuclease RuvC